MARLLNLYHYRTYILQNAGQELRSRYAGSGFGVLWNVLLPLSQVLIYTVIFSQIMSMRGATGRTGLDFVLYLCSGLFPWFAFSNTITRSTVVIRSNARYLALLPLPEELFVAKLVVVEFFILLIYFLFLFITFILVGQPVGWASLLVPVVAGMFQLLAFGIGVCLATLSVFFPDIVQAIGIMIRLGMWLAPIFYPESILSPATILILRWNPTFYFITTFHALLLDNRLPALSDWLIMSAWIVLFLFFAYSILRRLSPEIRDAL